VAALAFAFTGLGCPAERRPACDPAEAARQGAQQPPQRLCNPHAIVLVRHAEKAAVDPQERDPDLSPRGRERASRLAALLGKASIARLVATEYKRTQQTLVPLSEATGKQVDVRKAGQTNDLVRELREAPPGTTTVVATHSNVIPMLVRELGGGAVRDVGPEGALAENDYGRVFVLSVGCSTSASVIELSSD
jgi:broad specificity phosphatase PhoE